MRLGEQMVVYVFLVFSSFSRGSLRCSGGLSAPSVSWDETCVFLSVSLEERGRPHKVTPQAASPGSLYFSPTLRGRRLFFLTRSVSPVQTCICISLPEDSKVSSGSASPLSWFCKLFPLSSSPPQSPKSRGFLFSRLTGSRRVFYSRLFLSPGLSYVESGLSSSMRILGGEEAASRRWWAVSFHWSKLSPQTSTRWAWLEE